MLRECIKGTGGAAETARAIGFRHGPAGKSGSGQAPLLIWFATVGEMESEEDGEQFELVQRGLDAAEEGRDAPIPRCGRGQAAG